MAYRLKQQVDVIWLTEPMTLVTEWKRGFNGQPIPKRLATGHAGMALVVISHATGHQQKRFCTREEVETLIEEEAPPEHVQAETTYAYGQTWYPFNPTLAPLPTKDAQLRRFSDFFLDPPEAGKAV